jgi:hypothetical protein
MDNLLLSHPVFWPQIAESLPVKNGRELIAGTGKFLTPMKDCYFVKKVF